MTPSSQQDGDAELSPAEKESVLLGQLERQPGQFLRRWGPLLPGEALEWFTTVGDYEVDAVLRTLQRSTQARRAIVRNRR